MLTNNIYQWPRYTSETSQELCEFLKGKTFGDWNLGDIYIDVPKSYANKLGAKYGLFCSSGTSALHAALLALKIGKNDEVIVPAMTFIRSVTPLAYVGAKPVLADICSETGNIQIESILKCITTKTKAVIVVHMWGVPADIELIVQECKARQIAVIEDFSHAHFSTLKNNRYVGSVGDIGIASLQRKKLLSVGEGGLIVTSSELNMNRLKEITSPGSFETSKTLDGVDFSGYGLNLRMSPFSAVVAKTQLKDADRIIQNRRNTLNIFNSILSRYPEYFELPQIPKYVGEISWYSLKIKLKNNLSVENFKNSKLWKFSEIGYPMISEHKFWDNVKNEPGIPVVEPDKTFEFMGCKNYLKNRVTVNIPTVNESYWTIEKIEEWNKDLSDSLGLSVSYAVGVGVFHENKILLVKRKEDDFLGGYWELPGGGVDEDETFLESAIREVKEETAIELNSIDSWHFGFSYRNEGNETTHQLNGLSKILKIPEILLTEHSEAKWVAFNELENMDLSMEMRSCIEKLFEQLDSKIYVKKEES